MKVIIYAIGGKWSSGPSGDEYVGEAHDAVTASNLLDLIEVKGGYAVSLIGDKLGSLNAISGECGLNEARSLVAGWLRNPKCRPQLK